MRDCFWLVGSGVASQVVRNEEDLVDRDLGQRMRRKFQKKRRVKTKIWT